MKYLLLLVSILSHQAHAQITKQAILTQAQNTLLQASNERIASHFRFYESGSYYSYKENGSDELLWSKMEGDTLRGHPQQIYTQFYLTLPYPECPAYDTIGGNVKIVFDSALAVVQKPDLSYLPEFVLKGEGCNLLTEKEAMAITNNYKNVNANADYISALNYDAHGKFIWTIIVMPNDLLNQKLISVKIDAHTGELLTKE